ncbi:MULTISPECIES: FeoB-associated Cys-rich membrane protein [Myroides]|uniref:FeoB-associated Cys-rich membrane protein n=1 Tax=Myroides albus TaxID=2562892 RepID=A0A6I3LGL9_9FLAO|nr:MULTISPECIES: FeoB-associated Cys-rich membrane protein [Myroides]MTG96696.1 FeoB-associated Cys-rich membrane protein [Myroides albus]MVX34708.1 FeoB-associated Cys-rich membrane protein [Myroides sp. LoEW2-1]UVD80892.1 FeoB-associated Cys-rich membrane protein [Myroides albus]
MGYQEIIAYAFLIIAVGYLIKKSFWKNNSKKKGSCGGGSCGCS